MKNTTDKLSLLYNTDLDTIQNRLVKYYNINIDEISHNSHGLNVDELFYKCFNFVKESEVKKPVVRQKYFSYTSSPSSVFSEFETQLKRHALLTTAYTLEDQNCEQFFLITDPLHKKTAENIMNDFTAGTFDIVSDTYEKNGQQNVSFYFRNFLPSLTKAFLNTYKKKKGPTKFHNKNDITNQENKHLTILLKSKFDALIEFQQIMQDKICNDGRNVSMTEQPTKPISTLDKLLCFQKLESLTGADTLIYLLPYITPSKENEIRYKSIRLNQKYGEKIFKMPNIEDALLFQTLPNIFDRSTLITKYYEKEITKDELLYLRDRVIPLITNTFFCVLCKIFEDPHSVLKKHLNSSLEKPEDLKPSPVSAEILPFHSRASKPHNVEQQELICKDDLLPEEECEATYLYEKVLSPEKERARFFNSLQYYNPKLTAWYTEWSDAVFYISEEYNNSMDHKATHMYSIVLDFIDNCVEEERRKVLNYFFDNYASFKWFTPSSQLPNI